MKFAVLASCLTLTIAVPYAYATDTDGDGLSDDLEVSLGMDPNDATDFYNDTDGDFVFDGEEALDGTDINDATSFVDMLDRSVGTNGFASFSFTNGGMYDETYPHAIAQDDQGRVYFGGELDGEDSDFFFARLDAQYELDTTFSEDGFLFATEFSWGTETIYDVSFDFTDGPLLTLKNCVTNSCLAVLDDNGDLDEQYFPLQTQPGVYELTKDGSSGYAVYLDSDNSIYAAFSVSGYDGKTTIFKVGSDETVDDTFNENTGAITLNLLSGAGGEYITGIWKALDGDFLVGIRASGSSSRGVYIAKFSPEGLLDANWGTDGVLQIEGAYDYRDLQLIVDSSGGYFAYVTMGSSSNVGVSVLKLHSDGQLDTSFGTDGETAFKNFGGGYHYLTHFEQQADGTLVIVSAIGRGGDAPGVLVARLLSNGELDPSFYNNGTARFMLDSSATSTQAATVLQNHDIALTSSWFNAVNGIREALVFVVPNESDSDGDGIEDYLDDIDGPNETEDPVEDETGNEEDDASQTDDIPSDNKHELDVNFGGSMPMGLIILLIGLRFTRSRNRL